MGRLGTRAVRPVLTMTRASAHRPKAQGTQGGSASGLDVRARTSRVRLALPALLSPPPPRSPAPGPLSSPFPPTPPPLLPQVTSPRLTAPPPRGCSNRDRYTRSEVTRSKGGDSRLDWRRRRVRTRAGESSDGFGWGLCVVWVQRSHARAGARRLGQWPQSPTRAAKRAAVAAPARVLTLCSH